MSTSALVTSTAREGRKPRYYVSSPPKTLTPGRVIATFMAVGIVVLLAGLWVVSR